MTETDYSRASVLLFDPVHANMRTSRYTLNEIGFKKIACVSNIEEFDQYLTENTPELIVAECGSPELDMLGRVRKLRRSELGQNPFAVILLTTWLRDGQHIREVIESGADDLIVRPFSTQFAEERVRSLVKMRKDFVVTSDYVGPDRRKSSDRPSDAPAVQVPNILQAMVQKDEAALAEAASRVSQARQTIDAERIRRTAMRIVIAAELRISMESQDDKPAFDLSDLDRTARDLKSQLVRTRRREAADVAGALIEHLQSMAEEGGVTSANLRLVKELAMGAFAASGDDSSLERSKDEIARTVVNLRKRIQQRAEEAAAKAEARAAAAEAEGEGGEPGAESAGDDAGQGEQAGLKRAAM